MLRSKAASYAVAAMVELARRADAEGHTGEVQAHAIAEQYHLPSSYTAKILSQLARAGLLHSGRGPRGGFHLARRPEAVTLLEIFQAVGAVEEARFELSDQAPHGVQESLDRIMDHVFGQARDALAAATLQDLLDGAPRTTGAQNPNHPEIVSASV